ncbi:hypothetical protein BHM03_00041000 [Ensete ventricosum]|nr:hypothetical protein BHM03_00041000 [Ensete ventricosum]
MLYHGITPLVLKQDLPFLPHWREAMFFLLTHYRRPSSPPYRNNRPSPQMQSATVSPMSSMSRCSRRSRLPLCLLHATPPVTPSPEPSSNPSLGSGVEPPLLHQLRRAATLVGTPNAP